MTAQSGQLRRGLLVILAIVLVAGAGIVWLLRPKPAPSGATTASATPGPVEPAASPSRTAVPADDPAQVAQLADQIDGLVKALEAMERDIPRDTFDPQAVADRAGNDAAMLFEWVRDNTAWVPYRGALRGPVGLLMDRTGNSLDRSLLLAELLRRSGHTVRLARATLPQALAQELLAKVRTSSAASQPVALPDSQIDSAIKAQAQKYGLVEDRWTKLKTMQLPGPELRMTKARVSSTAAGDRYMVTPSQMKTVRRAGS